MAAFQDYNAKKRMRPQFDEVEIANLLSHASIEKLREVVVNLVRSFAETEDDLACFKSIISSTIGKEVQVRTIDIYDDYEDSFPATITPLQDPILFDTEKVPRQLQPSPHAQFNNVNPVVGSSHHTQRVEPVLRNSKGFRPICRASEMKRIAPALPSTSLQAAPMVVMAMPPGAVPNLYSPMNHHYASLSPYNPLYQYPIHPYPNYVPFFPQYVAPRVRNVVPTPRVPSPVDRTSPEVIQIPNVAPFSPEPQKKKFKMQLVPQRGGEPVQQVTVEKFESKNHQNEHPDNVLNPAVAARKQHYCICYSEGEDGDIMLRCQCGEWYHESCLNVYVDVRSTFHLISCPQCIFTQEHLRTIVRKLVKEDEGKVLEENLLPIKAKIETGEICRFVQLRNELFSVCLRILTANPCKSSKIHKTAQKFIRQTFVAVSREMFQPYGDGAILEEQAVSLKPRGIK